MYVTNKYQQLNHEIRKFLIITRGPFLMGMCGHWTSSKDFKFVCVVVKSQSNDKSNKSKQVEKWCLWRPIGLFSFPFPYINLYFEFCYLYCGTAIFGRRSHPKGSCSVQKNSIEEGLFCPAQRLREGLCKSPVTLHHFSQPFRVMDFPHLCLRRSYSLFYSGPKASGRVFMCWLCFVPIYNCVIL